ncbi:MAG: GNAT family N-acetyltransferase [Desulfovibrio sp.]|jgi:phosphinothricin acetyltransferase|nr:GNAT family N-acetyltransferase [Desulfovibrio sp.]
MTVIRFATEADATGILEIYAPYVRDTAVSFEESPPTPDEFRQRIARISAAYPYLVCEVDGNIAAYAYASSFRVRRAYRFSVELSIYVAKKQQGQGLGKSLYACLLDLLQKQGFYTAFGVITLPNPASLNIHEKLGFTPAGVWRRSGYKLNAWHDVCLLEKELQSPHPAPEPAEPLTVAALQTRYGTDIALTAVSCPKSGS